MRSVQSLELTCKRININWWNISEKDEHRQRHLLSGINQLNVSHYQPWVKGKHGPPHCISMYRSIGTKQTKLKSCKATWPWSLGGSLGKSFVFQQYSVAWHQSFYGHQLVVGQGLWLLLGSWCTMDKLCRHWHPSAGQRYTVPGHGALNGKEEKITIQTDGYWIDKKTHQNCNNRKPRLVLAFLCPLSEYARSAAQNMWRCVFQSAIYKLFIKFCYFVTSFHSRHLGKR